MRRSLAAAVVAALTVTVSGSPVAADGSFSPADSLLVARNSFDAVALGDGRVVVAGGTGPGAARSTEVYVDGVDSWHPAGDLNTARSRHTLTRLHDGTVVAVGGRNPAGPLTSAELFDPDTETWVPTGSLAVPRDNHSATLLADGRVLVAGGTSAGGEPVTSTAETYDPDSGVWEAAGSLRVPRYNHTATLLLDGRVLVAGGFSPGQFHTPVKNAEVFDPATGQWTVVAPMKTARAVHAAALLPDGSVLVAGGLVSPPNELRATASAEVWDPDTGRWQATGGMGTPRRALDDLVPVGSGRLLAIGGFDNANQLVASAETYDAATGTWQPAGAMAVARAPVVTALPGGRAIAIGSTGRVLLTTVEIWSP